MYFQEREYTSDDDDTEGRCWLSITLQELNLQYNAIQYNTIQYNTIQKFIALSTHIQHFKQTYIQFMKTRFSEEHN